MTIISTAESVTPLDLGEGSLDLFDEPKQPSFPPVTDTIQWFQDVDWADVRRRGRDGVNNVGLVLAVIGEKIHDLGVYLADL